jgi:hypothetical protein
MDKLQFAVVQNAARAVAAEAMSMALVGGIRGVVTALPDAAQSQFFQAMRDKLEATKSEYEKVSIPGYPPEYSDLMAGEFQEAFAKLSMKVMRKLEGTE